jgi:hypothetical protein
MNWLDSYSQRYSQKVKQDNYAESDSKAHANNANEHLKMSNNNKCSQHLKNYFNCLNNGSNNNLKSGSNNNLNSCETFENLLKECIKNS